MKIFYFCDESFMDMKYEFELSFKDPFEKNFFYLENINLDRSKPGSGVDIWKFKTEMVINSIKQNMGEIIIVSDIDIIFYKPVMDCVKVSMENHEICFQKEFKYYGLNIGFISILCNENTLEFWEKIHDVVSTTNRWDQEIVNDFIFNDKHKIKWNLFPSSIWNWSQGELNKDIKLHHANCASSKDEKFEQMKFVFNHINN